jgi:nitrate reductase NapD
MPTAQAAPLDVSGLVIYATPGAGPQALEALGGIEGLTVHAASAEGKIVATLETPDAQRSMELFERIGALAGVESVALVYHQIETDPDQEI